MPNCVSCQGELPVSSRAVEITIESGYAWLYVCHDCLRTSTPLPYIFIPHVQHRSGTQGMMKYSRGSRATKRGIPA
jgi:hypothetical protein